MASSSVPSQVISLPKGGGALRGIGEKFAPDLHTGTGNFTVPVVRQKVAGLPQPVRPDEDTDGKVASGSVTSDSLMRRDFRRARIDAETRGLARGAWLIGGRYAGGRAGRYAARRS